MSRFYDLTANTPSGLPLPMSDFKGKHVLIVNTATQCRLTPQFKSLEKIHQKFKDKGLIVLGFPCNQFKNQEPESNTQMEEICLNNHGVTFQLTEKIDVNGSNTHLIYRFLKQSKWSLPTWRIKWNFTKFLIDPQGIVLNRYSPLYSPKQISSDLEKIFSNHN